MQFESDFRFDMDDGYGMCNSSLQCTSATTSFSSASSTCSAYDPFTPSSRRSTPNELNLDFDGSCQSFGGSHHGTLTPPPAMHKYVFAQVKTEPERLSFSSADDTLPSTPLRKMNEVMPGYDHMLDMNLASHSMNSMTPSGAFPVYTVSPQTALQNAPFMMTPTHSLSGSEIADSSSSWCSNDSPISFFPQKGQSQGMEPLDLARYSQSPMNRYYLSGPSASPNRSRAQRKMMVHEIQRKTSELQRAQIRVSRKPTDKHDAAAVDVVRRAMCRCDYPGCHKAFRRNEHLKRHKQTFHGEGPNRFSCEFCGKDQFNRQDNLNNHRKLHARPNSRNRGVEFIPAAVAVIEQEERSRKRRAPPKSKTAAAAAAVKQSEEF